MFCETMKNTNKIIRLALKYYIQKNCTYEMDEKLGINQNTRIDIDIKLFFQNFSDCLFEMNLNWE